MELSIQSFVADHAEFNGQSHRPVSRRLVDLVQLARYTLGNRIHEREVLELFRTQSAVYLKRLKDTANAKEWQDAAQTIKDSAACIGAWGVAKAAERIERDGLAKKRNEIVDKLAHEIDETNRYIRKLLVDA